MIGLLALRELTRQQQSVSSVRGSKFRDKELIEGDVRGYTRSMGGYAADKARTASRWRAIGP